MIEIIVSQDYFSVKVGKILNQLFEEILDNPALNKKSYLLKRIKELDSLASL